MLNGFIKCAAANIEVRVADVGFNAERIKEKILLAQSEGVDLLCLPELCLTGYSCADLFLSDTLLLAAKQALSDIAAFTLGKSVAVVLGLPIEFGQKLYNCAAVVCEGEILGLVPKTLIPNYAESSEKRYFCSADNLTGEYNAVNICGEQVNLSARLIFRHAFVDNFRFAVEVCEDIWGNNTPANRLCAAGATVIVNPAASFEAVGKAEKRENLVKATSARYICGYAYCGAAASESTQDGVCGGQLIIAENGELLSQNPPFGGSSMIISEIDVDKLSSFRRRNTSYITDNSGITEVYFSLPVREHGLTRHIARNPFIAEDKAAADRQCEEILNIQAYGLKKRLEHTAAKTAVIGISGGLDSCLALIACVKAMDLMNRPRTDILAVTMPCFGTTQRTRSNAELLCELLGVRLQAVDIKAAVNQHFADIGHSENQKDITYENAQARERTQVLMDIANKENGMVIGTGDLSELALGWATYNGDQMSMYGVNASVSKTQVKRTVSYVAELSEQKLSRVLTDIVETPVSPELLPADEGGNIAQKTEDSVGPYELHDFFLYYTVHCGFSPRKILKLAEYAFEEDYSRATILKWLKVFLKRFFTQQFKRSCLPDGPAAGEVSLSPRAGFRMVSDASYSLWMKELEEIK